MRRSTIVWSAVASVAFLSVPSLGSAADLPRPAYKAPQYLSPAPVFSWTGFYIGPHVGYGWSRFSGDGDSRTAKGWLGGVQAGYNYQIGQFVIGIEGEYSWADVKLDEPLFGGTLSLKNDYFATAAARLGYAFDRSLVYAKLGAAWTRDKWDGNDGIGGTVSATSNRTGWLLGAGYEYAIWNNLSVKIEYNYLKFGSVTPSFTTTGTLTVEGSGDVKLDTQIVKVGLNYRFGGTGF
ncbi:MAG TPA: outer membrane protein [Pseudolabrys sp.]|nr:outer membrane protein [Pseudolabrys sp.]